MILMTTLIALIMLILMITPDSDSHTYSGGDDSGDDANGDGKSNGYVAFDRYSSSYMLIAVVVVPFPL
jgi:hypothetical protein